MDHEKEDLGFNEHQAKVLALTRMISGSLSFIASTAMIIIIAKSTKRFTTTQNRLILGLSLTDIIFSITTSLTSMPAPKGTPNMWKPMGNQMTCDAQGFLQTFCVFSTPLYNCALCTFFLLKIRYKISDETIRTRVEPIFHIIAIVIPLSVSIHFLLKEYFNPYNGTCYVSDYPTNCSLSDDTPCERGENILKDGVIVFCYVLFALQPVIICGTMLTMFITVQQQEARMARFGIGSLRLGGGDGGAPRQKMTRTKSRYVRIAMQRAFAYSGAWFMTFIFPTITYIKLKGSAPDSSDFTLAVLMSIFHPLQGVFNFLVFIYPKIHLMRQRDPNCSLCRLLSSLRYVIDERRERPKNSMIVRSVQEIIDAGDDDILKLDAGGCDDEHEKQNTNNTEENTSVKRLRNVHDIQLADVFAPQTASLTPVLVEQQEHHDWRVNDESDMVVSEEEKVEIS